MSFGMGRSETAWPSIVAVSKKRCGAVVRNTAVDVRRHDVFQSIWRQLWRSALRRYSPSTFGLRHDPVELVEGPRAKKVSQIPQFQLFQTPSSPGRIENCPAESGELYQLALAATERAGTGWCRIFGRYRGGVTRGTCRAETPQQIFTATPFSRAENVIIWPGF